MAPGYFSACPSCGEFLHIDTGSIIDFEDGLIPDPVLFCSGCGFECALGQENGLEGGFCE